MAPAKLSPTQAQRLEAARLVIYELWMLRECAVMPKPADRIVRNLWYEGLVLHARVLRDFFFTKHTDKGKRIAHEGDVVAVDYFRSASSWPYTSNDLPSYLKKNKDRMDWALAHLSFHRLGFTGLDKEWSADSLRSEIGTKWLEFIQQLQALGEPAAPSFVQHAKRLNVPLTGTF
jgi:hypothetical protein